MKTKDEWKRLVDQANERREPLYITPEELRELREREATHPMTTFAPPRPDW